MKTLTFLFLMTALSLTLADNAMAMGQKLTQLRPTDTEYGTLEYPNYELRDIAGEHGKGVIDTGVFLSGNKHWPNAQKVVKQTNPRKQVTSEDYWSKDTDLFLVQGEQVTGVGLWVQTKMMYHWLEYDIPFASKRFTGLVYLTDDAYGYMRHMPGGRKRLFPIRNATFTVEIDGNEIFSKEFYKQGDSKGGLIAELDIDIPSNAETIKFKLQASDGMDWNKNTELVITEGEFTF